ncbi:MAG: ABC transporter permease subunit [Thermoproteota archaeon]|nr:ABC transporter permease subunit [Candidatus Brockarchaeota archaeon]
MLIVLTRKKLYFFTLLATILLTWVPARLVTIRANLLEASLGNLAILSLFSLGRMTTAYLLGLISAILLEIWVSRSEHLVKYIFPVLDVLQSVPILGFLPAGLLVIRQLAPGRLGTELVSIFLIFTSQAWALMYSALEGFTTIPSDLLELKKAFNQRESSFIIKILLPYTFPFLVSGSILAFGGGWYFLMAAESFSLGNEQVNLPGLGTFLFYSAYTGNLKEYLLGLLVLLLIVVFIHEIFWSPLSEFSKNFRYEFTSGEVTHKPALTIKLIFSFTKVILRTLEKVYFFFNSVLTSRQRVRNTFDTFVKFTKIVLIFLIVIYLAFSLYSIQPTNFSFTQLQASLLIIVEASICMIYSFFRVFTAYIVTLFLVIPLGIIAARTVLRKLLLPIFDIMQSTPAIAFFPFLIVFISSIMGINQFSINLISLVLTMTGMIWYLLFNVVISLSNIPEDIEEMLKSFKAKTSTKILRIYLPAAAGGIFYGTIQAFGGGYNALVVSEYITFGSQVLTVRGIGSFLNKYSNAGNVVALTVGLFVFIVFVATFDRLVWVPILNRIKRFRFGD